MSEQTSAGSPSDEVKEPVTTTESPPQAAPDPVRRTTFIVLALCLFVFVWYVLADRFAPWTDQARVQGYVVPIVPQVSGDVLRVDVVQDELVKAGDLLLEIDPERYQAELQRAQADLELAGQTSGADTEAVAVAQANLTEAQAQLGFYQKQAVRYRKLAKSGVISKSQAEQTETEIAKAGAQVKSAEAELGRAKQQLGKTGSDNAKVRAALAALKQAQINLADTRIVAPADGGLTNLNIDVGNYAEAGKPLMTFISADEIWIKAYIRENGIGNMQVGDAVDIVLDIAPGRVFPGKVSSIGFAVSQASGGQAGELETVKASSSWLRDAQRFPVIVRFEGDAARGLRRIGGQADVQFYGDNALLNGLGYFWIRLMSLLSFVY